MIKAIDKMHTRSKMVRVGMSCMGQQLVGAYRTMCNEEDGKTFCMMMYWNGFNKSVSYAVQESDEYMHLFFEDVERNSEREYYLRENGKLALDSVITESKEYKRVYEQLLRSMKKKMIELGYEVLDDLTIKN